MRQALKLALEALQVATTPLAKDRQEVIRAITAIKEALAQPEEEKLHPVHIGVDVTKEGTAVTAFYRKPDAVMEVFYAQFHPMAQPEQEPVAWTEKVGGIGFKEPMPNANYKVTATIAPQRKPLTDEQIDGIASKFYPRSYGLDEFARAIEAAHGIKE